MIGGDAILIFSLSLAVVTFVNPLDISYRQRVMHGKTFREAADPEIIMHVGRHWLFASMCGRYFVSDDLVTWKGIESKDLPFEEYAPTVEEIDGALHFTARGGTVHRADELLSGIWEKKSQKIQHPVDSALFKDDDGRLYLYWGGSASKHPLFAAELDPQTFDTKGRVVRTLEEDSVRYGWEVRGHRNEMTNEVSYIEGSHMVKRNGTYYLQYASPGTQFDTYSDSVMTGLSPVGPFVRQMLNPFSLKTAGYVTSSGHGKTFRDKIGNWWHVATGLIGNESFAERRLVMFPVFFDDDGEMWCDTAFSDWPIVVPDCRTEDPNDYHSGWMPLSYGKRVTASSSISGHDPSLAVDGTIRTFWSANGGKGSWVEVDLGDEAEVQSVQIGFADSGFPVRSGIGAMCRYRIEMRMSDGAWRKVVETTETCEREHPYHQFDRPIRTDRLRVVCVEMSEGLNFALREVRAFGRMNKMRPSNPEELSVVRDAQDRRRATISWKAVEGAEGYLLRYGPTLEKAHLSRLVIGAVSVEIRSLDAKVDYRWTVSSFNEAGFSN